MINKTYLQHLSCPQNIASPFPLLPMQDLRVIGFSFISIVTLAPSTIYSRFTAPPLLGDRTALAAATPEPPGPITIHSLSINLETPLPWQHLLKIRLSFPPSATSLHFSTILAFDRDIPSSPSSWACHTLTHFWESLVFNNPKQSLGSPNCWSHEHTLEGGVLLYSWAQLLLSRMKKGEKWRNEMGCG